MGDADGSRLRIGRLIAWIGSIGGTIALAAALTWELGPRFAPALVIDWSPSDAHALRAYALHQRDAQLLEHVYHRGLFQDDDRLWAAAMACATSREKAVRHLACEALVDRLEGETPSDFRSGRALDLLATCARELDFTKRGSAAWVLATFEHREAQAVALSAFQADPEDVDAAEALGISGCWAMFPEVLQSWRGALGEEKMPRSIHFRSTFDLFGGSEPDMRSALIEFSQSEVTPALIELLDSIEARERELAIEMLATRSEARATDALLQRATGTVACFDRAARVLMIAEMARWGRIAPDALVDIAGGLNDACADTAFACLLEHQILDIPRARRLAQRASPTIRLGALIQLENLNSYDDLDFVIATLDDPDPQVAQEAVNVLASWPVEIVADPLAAQLRHRDPRHRALAMRVAGAREEPVDDGVIAAGLADSDAALRGETLLVIGRQGRSAYAPQVLASLRDERAGIRGSAASALGRLRAETATLDLLDLLDRERDPRVAAAVLIALERCDAEATHAERIEARRAALLAEHGEALDSPWDDW